MKRFLKLSLLFALPVLLVLCVCECLVRCHPNSYRYKHEWMMEHRRDVNTLILGASQAYAGIKPDLLDDCAFNLANVSQHYEHDWWLLSHYGEEMPRLKTVILTLDDCMPFEGPLEDAVESYRATYYRLYMGHDKHSWVSRWGLECINVTQFRAKLNRVVAGNTSLDCDSLGWGTTFGGKKKCDETTMRRLALNTWERHRCRDRSMISYNMQFVDSVGQWCLAHGVQLVLVTPPLWQGYVREVMDPWQRGAVDSLGRATAQKHQALYLNCMDDTTYTIADFHDADHLSPSGAAKFTARIKPIKSIRTRTGF